MGTDLGCGMKVSTKNNILFSIESTNAHTKPEHILSVSVLLKLYGRGGIRKHVLQNVLGESVMKNS